MKEQSKTPQAPLEKSRVEQACDEIIDIIDNFPCSLEDKTNSFKRIREILRSDTAPYCRNSKIRSFLNETISTNPLIPKSINGISYDHRFSDSKKTRKPFLEALKECSPQIEINTYEPDLNLYRNFLEKNADLYEPRFGANPLHGTRYFFMKTLEHFITFCFIGEFAPSEIMDVGSSGPTYCQIIGREFPDKKLISQDLKHANGMKEVTETLSVLGGSAAVLLLPDNSIDLATFHCSIEHFEGPDDIACVKEIERILKPGGSMIVVPLHTSVRHTLSINAITGPFVNHDFIDQVIKPELEEAGACFRYTTGMISPFARRYSAQTLYSRLLSNTNLKASVYSINIGDKMLNSEILSENYFNGAYKRFVPHAERYFLKLTKRV